MAPGSERPGPVLVTGAAGFLGRHVTADLIARGHAVRVLEHRSTLPADLRARCEVVTGDLRDRALRRAALRGVDAVCHLAAHVPGRLDDPAEARACLKSNALATLDLATEAADLQIRRFVYASSGSVYSALNRPSTETDPTFPTPEAAIYATSKLAGEIYLSQVCARSAMQAVILRLGAPYGPGAPARQVIPTFLRRAAAGQALELSDGGAARYNFVRTEDVVVCVAKALETPPAGIFNVAAGEHVSIRALAETIAGLYGRGAAGLVLAPADGAGRAGLPAMDIARARRAWGVRPWPLARGLAALAADR